MKITPSYNRNILQNLHRMQSGLFRPNTWHEHLRDTVRNKDTYTLLAGFIYNTRRYFASCTRYVLLSARVLCQTIK